MPKKTKAPKPIPSALTVASPAQPRLETAPPKQRRAVSGAKPKPKPPATAAKTNAHSTGTPKKTSTARTTITPKAAAPPAESEPVTFVIANAHAHRVALSGDFNHWSADATLMNRDLDGTWRITLALPPGRHQYKFIVDGHWMADPNAPEQVADGHGATNSLIEVRG
jgi:hypothetical protein